MHDEPVRNARARRNLMKRSVRLLRQPRRIPAALGRRLGRRTPPPPAAPAVTPPPPAATHSPAERRRLITRAVNLDGLGLEIGPSHNPLLAKRDGYNIRIADHLDEEGLKEKYSGQRPTHKIEKVDYVLKPGRLTESISDQFDYIVASHVAEHTVCLISFLQDCEALLRPGGVLSLALPDKRYCFDRFRERTSLARVIDVHHAAPSVHTEGSVLEHNLYHARKGDQVAWSKDAPGPFRLVYSMEEARQRADMAVKGEYVDTHNWVLTPHHFRLLVEDLRQLGFIGLREHSFHDTVNHEFFISLSVEGSGSGVTREELLVLSAQELMTPEPVTVG